MSQELNLDDLERRIGVHDGLNIDEAMKLVARIRELERAQPAGEAAKPVAWVRMTDNPITKDSFACHPDRVAEHAKFGIHLTPLYAAPALSASPAALTNELILQLAITTSSTCTSTEYLFEPRALLAFARVLLAAAPHPTDKE